MAKKILIVDDEQALAGALKSKFEAAGYEASIQSNGQEAIEAIANGEYDLMLLDILMPVIDGWQVLEAVKGKGMKVVVTSNLSQEEDVIKAKELGASDFLVKSDVSLSEIIEKVAALLE